MQKQTHQRWLTRAATIMLGSALLSPGAVHAQAGLDDLFGNALACTLVEPLLADMPSTPLHTLDEAGDCRAVEPQLAGSYYSDAACEQALSFVPTSMPSYCEVLLDADQLGEGQDIIEDSWTLSPGSRLDIGARALDGVQWPYLQRRIYRTVDTEQGRCSLEMRVYAPEPGASDSTRPSLLAFHGGSWSARGFGFAGLEMSIPHYVDQGFVVYAPFYRLLDDKEGSAACHQASIDAIVDDANAALAWVSEHATHYGSSPRPAVFGQSAGAHLALSLAVNAPESVVAAVLLYPPTDFTDFVVQAQQGYYSDEQGLDIISRVLGASASEADVSASPIPENSFPQRIIESDLTVPPMLMIHGLQDTLVEARQSVRLCDALAGRELTGSGVEVALPDGLRSVQACGPNAELHLITQGQHALDVCVADTVLPTDLCLSGSETSREAVASSLGDAVDFALAHADGSEDDTDADQTGGTGDTDGADSAEDADGAGEADGAGANRGSGALDVFWLVLGLPWLLYRCRRESERR